MGVDVDWVGIGDWGGVAGGEEVREEVDGWEGNAGVGGFVDFGGHCVLDV